MPFRGIDPFSEIPRTEAHVIALSGADALWAIRAGGVVVIPEKCGDYPRAQIRTAAAVEPVPMILPEPFINREKPWPSDTDGRVGDREQLRRYFLQERHDDLAR